MLSKRNTVNSNTLIFLKIKKNQHLRKNQLIRVDFFYDELKNDSNILRR